MKESSSRGENQSDSSSSSSSSSPPIYFYVPAPKTIAIIEIEKLSRIQSVFRRGKRNATVKNTIRLLPFGFLPNNFFISMGLLEFGNASDFGANVFNARPVPKIGMIFMAIGGTFAVLVSLVALADLKRSIPNYKRLKQERADILQAQQNVPLRPDVSSETPQAESSTNITSTDEKSTAETSAEQTQHELRIEEVAEEQTEEVDESKVENVDEEKRLAEATQQASSDQNGDAQCQSIDCSWDALLAVNTLDLRMELIKRIIASVLLGTSCVLVGIGTYMAIGGNHPKVYFASNLLSGYIGNFPSLLYGIVNFSWSIYLIKRTTRQRKAAERILGKGLYHICLRSRHRHMANHGALDGFFSLLAGVASMITATRWWGYVVLAPCVILSLVWSYTLRHHVRYERNLFLAEGQDVNGSSRTPAPVVIELNELVRHTLEREQVPTTKIKKNEIMMYDLEKEGEAWESRSTSSLLDEIVQTDLFTQLALMMAKSPKGDGLRFFTRMEEEFKERFILTVHDVQQRELEGEDEQFVRRLAIQCLLKNREYFDSARQRYREELLGCSLTTLEKREIIPKLEVTT